MSILGILLCGGSSQRMGFNKKPSRAADTPNMPAKEVIQIRTTSPAVVSIKSMEGFRANT